MGQQHESGSPAAERFVDENRKAEEHIDKGELTEAARVLVDIVDNDRDNWRAFNNMGIVSWMQKAWHDAYDMFLRAARLNPRYGDALVNLFDAALKLRRVKEVAGLFSDAAQLDGAAEEVRVIAQAVTEQGDDIYLSERGLVVGTYHARIESANKLLEEGQLNKAMEIYLDVNDREGPNADAFGGLGVVSYYQERYNDAFALFLESIKINPLNPDMYLNLIDAAKESGRTEDARNVYRTYVKEFPALQSLAEEFDKL